MNVQTSRASTAATHSFQRCDCQCCEGNRCRVRLIVALTTAFRSMQSQITVRDKPPRIYVSQSTPHCCQLVHAGIVKRVDNPNIPCDAAMIRGRQLTKIGRATAAGRSVGFAHVSLRNSNGAYTAVPPPECQAHPTSS